MLQWADTFNRYGTDATLLLNGIYAEAYSTGATDGVHLVTDPDLTSTQKVLRHVVNLVTSTGFRYAFPGGAKATMGFATRLWMAALPTSGTFRPGWEFRDANNVAQVCVVINTTGTISVIKGGADAGGTVLATTTVPVLTANAYNHIEIKATINSAAGAVEVRVNGASVIAITGANTQSTALASTAQLVFWAANSSGMTTYHKDFVVWDTTGTYNNNFLGSVSVLDRDPVSDVSLTWAPSTGTAGWSILDNNPPVDTIYVSAATPLSNRFGLQDLPADVTSVRGLILVNRSWKIDGGDGNVQMGIISGASTGLGTDRPITTAPTYWPDVIEVDPATGVPFTPSGFNASDLKQSRTV